MWASWFLLAGLQQRLGLFQADLEERVIFIYLEGLAERLMPVCRNHKAYRTPGDIWKAVAALRIRLCAIRIRLRALQFLQFSGFMKLQREVGL